MEQWQELAPRLEQHPPSPEVARKRDRFLAKIERVVPGSYMEAIRQLCPETKQSGVAWLQAIVDSYTVLGEPFS